MADDLKAQVKTISETLVVWRRALHKIPELGFEEHETGRFLSACLTELGIDHKTGVGKTGIIGVIRAEHAEKPSILLRADMDGLPIDEVAGRTYGSTHPGRMHACGHDGHMAMLLGAAKLLAASRDRLRRDVVLCFQPAEEGAGGAEAILGSGVLEEHGVGEAYGLHLWSAFPSGTIQVRPGPTMAAQDEFVATFVGRGGHGALPHAAIDPVVAASLGVVALQSVVARSVDPIRSAVVTIGSMHAGRAPNVIPDDATMHGTMRSFHEDVRETLRRRVQEVLEGTASASGCRLEYTLYPGFPAVVNDPAAVDALRRHAAEVVGSVHVIEPDPMAAAEDFAYFLKRVPGAFAFIGARNEVAGITAPHHSPRFDIDEAALPIGAELLARVALG